MNSITKPIKSIHDIKQLKINKISLNSRAYNYEKNYYK